MQISFIGAGNMAGAIIRSIVSSGRVKACDISIYDINTEKCESFSKLGVNVVDSISSVVCASPIVFLAVKPQNYDEVLKDIGKVTGIDFSKRIRTLGEIKQELAETKKK